jgi:hypothetical protein
MALLVRRYTHSSMASGNARPQMRYGKPHRPLTTPTRYKRQNHSQASDLRCSHMPLDIEIHWNWRNPLNLIPALIVALLLIAVIGTVLS